MGSGLAMGNLYTRNEEIYIYKREREIKVKVASYSKVGWWNGFILEGGFGMEEGL